LAVQFEDPSASLAVLKEAGGFLYYVSITGITGAASAVEDEVAQAVAGIRAHTDLPIAVGFGIRTPEQAAAFARIGDAAVVGSGVVAQITDSLTAEGAAGPDTVARPLALVRDLADGVRAARQ
jgi:tryptophan synthase alpha chain